VAKTDILILGDGVETALYLELVRSLVPLAKRLSLRLVFRPHPLERRFFAAAPQEGGFVLDTNPDVYASFERASVVISEVSTGLFEAVGLAGRVLMWETAKARFSFPHHFFEAFAEPEELEQILSQPARAGLSDETVDRTWAPGWKSNYERFVATAMA
jgi:hypothetical protein